MAGTFAGRRASSEACFSQRKAAGKPQSKPSGTPTDRAVWGLNTAGRVPPLLLKETPTRAERASIKSEKPVKGDRPMTGPFYVTYPVGDALFYTSEAGEMARYDTAEEAATVVDNVLKLGLANYARVHRWEAPVE